MSLVTKYSIVAVLFFITGLLFVGQISYAQTAVPQAISTQIPFIEPQIAKEASKLIRSTDICPQTNNPLIARCYGKVIMDDTATPFITTKPAGFGPAEFREAYDVTGKANKTPIVDAYDQPDMLSDLQQYSTTFNFPQLTTCSGTITKSTTA